MRIGASIVIAASLVSAVAAADPSAVELVAHGEALAKDGYYSEAIDAFKAAERLAPSAHHQCLIALAYTRRELWPQAEIYLDACRAGATATDPVPGWFPEIVQLLHDRLAAAHVAAVELTVSPATSGAKLSVSSFPPDETFAPRTIHLPPGHHVIRATAPGYESADAAIDITDDSAHHVAIRLARISPAYGPTPRRLVLAGGIAVLAGGITYAVMGYAWSKLEDAYPNHATEYGRYHALYVGTRYATWGLWAAGAGLAITGYLLHRRDDRFLVAAAPLDGGGLLAVGWQR